MFKEQRSWRSAFCCAMLVWVHGCGGGDSDPRTCTFGSDCEVACTSGNFIVVGSESLFGDPGVCVPPCATTEECDDGLVCSEVAAGIRGCVARCTTQESAPFGFGCVDQVPTPCSLAQPGDIPCERCCDPLSTCRLCQGGEFCAVFDSGTCEALRVVGEPCRLAEECVSRNCAGSTLDEAGVCQVAHGQPCDGSNCSRCINTGSTTFCHQECSGPLGCPVGFQNCLGSRDDDRYWCHQDASGFSCPAAYDAYTYQEFNGSPSRTACTPLSNAFVCGTASVGLPCN